MSEADYQHALTYDNRRHTRPAARAAWELFLKENPDSPHAEQVRLRLAELAEAPAKPPTEAKSAAAPAPEKK